MNAIARFEFVTPDQLAADLTAQGLSAEQPVPALPRRATSGSAGYDFVCPVPVVLRPGESATIPTGVRCAMDPGWVLLIYPRSGLGFKYRMRLDNTVGVIDSDYYGAANQGHILVRVTNGSDQQTLTLQAGERFCQGVLTPYGLAEEDAPAAKREGGLGSTGARG